ncbi:MAG: methyltransferase domain-containing protein [Pseudomonadota bacterium]
MDNGWNRSAEAWLALIGEEGDFSRKHVLDAPMLKRVTQSGARTVLDVGCGEGRFCRMMAEAGLAVMGIDPTAGLLEVARARGGAQYVEGWAEALPFEAGTFGLVVFYLSLIDIKNLEAAVAQAARVLRPSGRILVGNLNAWITASQTKSDGWTRDEDGSAAMVIDRYLDDYPIDARWAGMDIVNWHRPLSRYMQVFLKAGLQLLHFDEPRSHGAPERRYDCAPYLYLMEWQKPGLGPTP